MSRAVHSVVVGMLLGMWPSAASAFSDYELFGIPPLEGGGGGGRYFTGSTSDGYTCGVCHLGGTQPVTQLRGLPDKEVIAGVTYDVELSWLYPQFRHALNLEFVTPQGQAAGIIALPDPSVLGPQDLCDAEHGGTAAAHLIEESAPRQVLWVDDCGAQRVRFRFTASADPQFMFAAAVVRTDNSEKPEGDGVTEVRRELYRQGLAPSESGCSASTASSDRLGLRCFGLSLAALLGARRKRRAL